MKVYTDGRGRWCAFIGRLRVRWASKDFKPLFSERYGYRKWRKIGRLGFLWDRSSSH